MRFRLCQLLPYGEADLKAGEKIFTVGCSDGRVPRARCGAILQISNGLIYYLPKSISGDSGSAVFKYSSQRDAWEVVGRTAWAMQVDGKWIGLAMTSDRVADIRAGRVAAGNFDLPEGAVPLSVACGGLPEGAVTCDQIKHVNLQQETELPKRLKLADSEGGDSLFAGRIFARSQIALIECENGQFLAALLISFGRLFALLCGRQSLWLCWRLGCPNNSYTVEIRLAYPIRKTNINQVEEVTMDTRNLFFVVLFLLAVPVGLVACDLIVPQEPIEVPMVVETQIGQTSCEPCLQAVTSRVVDRVVFERPVMEKVVQVTRERVVRRKPVRSLLRRLLRR